MGLAWRDCKFSIHDFNETILLTKMSRTGFKVSAVGKNWHRGDIVDNNCNSLFNCTLKMIKHWRVEKSTVLRANSVACSRLLFVWEICQVLLLPVIYHVKKLALYYTTFSPSENLFHLEAEGYIRFSSGILLWKSHYISSGSKIVNFLCWLNMAFKSFTFIWISSGTICQNNTLKCF